jgi:hypothetical protein
LRFGLADLLSEADLPYYSAYACGTLELFLEGKPITVGAEEQQAGLDADESSEVGVAEGEGTSSASLQQGHGGDLPSLDEEDDFPTWALEFVWPERDGAGRVEEIPFGVSPVMEKEAEELALLTMQQEYLALGCAEAPESEKCLSSSYAKRVQFESGYGDAK